MVIVDIMYENSPSFLVGLQALKVWALVREDAASITAAVEANLENMLPAGFEFVVRS